MHAPPSAYGRFFTPAISYMESLPPSPALATGAACHVELCVFSIQRPPVLKSSFFSRNIHGPFADLIWPQPSIVACRGYHLGIILLRFSLPFSHPGTRLNVHLIVSLVQKYVTYARLLVHRSVGVWFNTIYLQLSGSFSTFTCRTVADHWESFARDVNLDYVEKLVM
jgi:hypothetical protein